MSKIIISSPTTFVKQLLWKHNIKLYCMFLVYCTVYMLLKSNSNSISSSTLNVAIREENTYCFVQIKLQLSLTL